MIELSLKWEFFRIHIKVKLNFFLNVKLLVFEWMKLFHNLRIGYFWMGFTADAISGRFSKSKTRDCRGLWYDTGSGNWAIFMAPDVSLSMVRQ